MDKQEQNLIYHISQEMFQPSAFKSVDGCFVCPQITGQFDDYKFSEPIVYNLTLTNTGDAFLLAGKLTAKAVTSCSRCLEDVEVEIVGDVDSYFLIEEPTDLDENQINEFEILPADHNIDLGAIIKATLMVEAPVKPLCSQDCKGLCDKCGINLNVESCTCADEPDPSNPFSVLKDFHA